MKNELDNEKIYAIVYFLRKIFVSADSELIEFSIKIGIIELFTNMLDIDNMKIRKEILWTLINISADSYSSGEIFIKNSLHLKLLALIQISDFDIIHSVFLLYSK